MRGYTQTYKIDNEEVEVIRVDNDVNGNPRFVIWYGDLLRLAGISDFEGKYIFQTALKIARDKIDSGKISSW